MGKIILLFTCFVVIQIAVALNCYNCRTTGNDTACEKISDSMQKVECGIPASPEFKVACLTRVLKDKTTNVKNVARKCILTNENNIDHECKLGNKQYNVSLCSSCDSDYCNNASV